MSDYKVGDRVRVKGTTTPKMTVTGVNQSNGLAYLTWFKDGEWKRDKFHSDVLAEVASN